MRRRLREPGRQAETLQHPIVASEGSPGAEVWCLMRTLSVRGLGIWVLPLALCQLQIFAYKISHTCIPQHFPSISLHSSAEWFLRSSVFNQRSMWAAFSRSFLLHTVNRLLNLALFWSLLTLQKRLNIFVCQRLCESQRTWLLWYKQSSRLGLHSL